MFEKASRLKVRFASSIGMFSVEELWELPLTSKTGKANLDDIARALHKQLKNDDNVSFVETSRKSDDRTQLMFDIVRHVIEVKIAENAVKAQEVANKEKRQRILEILEQKKEQSLLNLSIEELEKML